MARESIPSSLSRFIYHSRFSGVGVVLTDLCSQYAQFVRHLVSKLRVGRVFCAIQKGEHFGPQQWTRLPDDYQEIYQQALKEMQQPDFVGDMDIPYCMGH